MIDYPTIQHSPRIELRARKLERKAKEKRDRSLSDDLRGARGILLAVVLGTGMWCWLYDVIFLVLWLRA